MKYICQYLAIATCSKAGKQICVQQRSVRQDSIDIPALSTVVMEKSLVLPFSLPKTKPRNILNDYFQSAFFTSDLSNMQVITTVFLVCHQQLYLLKDQKPYCLNWIPTKLLVLRMHNQILINIVFMKLLQFSNLSTRRLTKIPTHFNKFPLQNFMFIHLFCRGYSQMQKCILNMTISCTKHTILNFIFGPVIYSQSISVPSSALLATI